MTRDEPLEWRHPAAVLRQKLKDNWPCCRDCIHSVNHSAKHTCTWPLFAHNPAHHLSGCLDFNDVDAE